MRLCEAKRPVVREWEVVCRERAKKNSTHPKHKITQPVASIIILASTNRPETEKHTTQLKTAGPFVQGNRLF